MGTPTERSWPGLSLLPNYSPNLLPTWPKTPLSRRDWRDLDKEGVDLLEVGGRVLGPVCRYVSVGQLFVRGRKEVIGMSY